MDVALSDLLTCPRCGPTYALVLLPYEVVDRRVRSGVLGCANCRERYPVEDGVADLRGGSEGVPAPSPDDRPGSISEASGAPDSTGDIQAEAMGAGIGAGDASEPLEVRLAGLMGLAEARGTVFVAGPAGEHAAALSGLVEGVEVAVRVRGAEPRRPDPAEGAAVSPMRIGAVIPFRSGSLRGVALTGASTGLLEEGARVLGSEGRLVVSPAPADAGARLEAAGLSVVAEEGGVVVASRRS